jgi:hypothetical protein
MNNFKIFATFTKSFDNQHGISVDVQTVQTQGSNNLHLIASTIAYFGDLDYNLMFRNMVNDKRNKKTIIIEVSEILSKNTVVNIDEENYLFSPQIP